MTELMKDIKRQPQELTKSLTHTLGPGRAALMEATRIAAEAEHLYLTGIGSSDHAGMAVRSLFHAAGRPVLLIEASELLHFTPLPAGAVLVVLSRSGRSVEIVKLMTKAAVAGAKVVAITNTQDSPLAQQADAVLLLEVAFDHCVSVTMYSALALVGGLFAAATTNHLDNALESDLAQALTLGSHALPTWQRQIADSNWFMSNAATYFLARNGSMASASEARLLWEEVAKAPASAMTSSAFRHGPQEIVGEHLRVGMWICEDHLREQDLTLAADLKDLGVKVMLIGAGIPASAGDLVFELPSVPAGWEFLIDIMPLQLAAEHHSHVRGVDCDTFTICSYIIDNEGGLIDRDKEKVHGL